MIESIYECFRWVPSPEQKWFKKIVSYSFVLSFSNSVSLTSTKNLINLKKQKYDVTLNYKSQLT